MHARRLAGLAVLAVWLSIVGWHVRREYYQPEGARLAAGARTLAPGVNWYTIRMDGVAIGIGRSHLDTLPHGFEFFDETTLDIPALGRVQRARAVTRMELSEQLDLRTFRFLLESELGQFTVSGSVEADSSVALVMDAGAGPQHSRMKISERVLLDGALLLRMAASGALRVGNELSARIFDPSSMAERVMQVRVTERGTIVVPDSAQLVDGRWEATLLDTVPVFRVEQKFGGVSIANWVDEDGQIVRAESPLGFTIERTAYELARQAWRSGAAGELASGYGALIEGTAISSNVDLGTVPARAQLSVRLRGVNLSGFDLAGGRQQLRGDTLVVTRESAPAATYSLPYRGGGPPTEELAATPLIQSEDPRIQTVARRVAAGSNDPAEVARRLNEWVYSKLRKDVTLSVPSALQVLEAERGDCNEHTVLYVALARALGLPARTAVGLVHLRGNFYYHAWPEVWLGEWVAVDPTLGQYPADASHLRFLVGGLARQVELIRLIGRLQLEVL
jgi:transglutaminase-like putative cysteine protease